MRKEIWMASLLCLSLMACSENSSNNFEESFAVMDSITVQTHLKILSDDSFEGRGTGTPGEQKAIGYISDEMSKMGLEPAGENGTFYQNVPLVGSKPAPASPLTFKSKAGETISLNFLDDFIVSTDLTEESISTEGELIFVGYGVYAEDSWNDYKDIDVKGKIIVSFVNDPPATEEDPDRFEGEALTYYGRWTYKYEEARRRGAKGAILIHTVPTASYPFAVLSNSAASEQIQLADPPENPLEMKGWITQQSAEKLASMCGTTLDDWFAKAASPDFQPEPLDVIAQVAVDYTVRHFQGTNVIGKLTGTDRIDEVVVYTAHHDHLGIGQPNPAGDSIYNGAVDNASGVSELLTIAKGFTSLPNPPSRSILFITFTAEESGLLGAQFYARNPVVPLAKTIANINVDSGNVLGETNDVVGIGSETSDMYDILGDAAKQEGLIVTDDPNPNAGYFFRSDQLAFARGGVPAVFINTGSSFKGKPESYAEEMEMKYLSTQYHQPDDEFDPNWEMGGLLQQVRVAFRMGYSIANMQGMPQWKEGVAFEATRKASLASR